MVSLWCPQNIMINTNDDLPGHEVLNPKGKIIRVPAFVMAQLRVMGLLRKSRGKKLLQIDSRIEFFMKHPKFLANIQQKKDVRAFNPVTIGMRSAKGKVTLMSVLGEDCSGPQVVECYCRSCQKKISDEYVPMPFPTVARHINKKRKK